MDPHSFIARAEAQRWLGIAEKLLMGHDLVGSKTFAIRARDSDPRLEAADQILAIADTLLSAEKPVVGNNGAQQPDYYAILQLVRFAQDTDHITSQYRRLAVTLNPHQNRFPYSDQAFQLVNDAWAVLSNPMRKSIYDSELDQMNYIGFNLEQHQQEQQQHQQHQQQQQHNFFSINHIGSGHEQELPESQQTFQTRVQQQQQQQLQQHNFLSQNPVRPVPVREQEQLFQPQSLPPHKLIFGSAPTQVQPFRVTSPLQQQTRPPPQPPQPQATVQPPTPPPPAAPPQPPLSWPQPSPISPPPQAQQQRQEEHQHHHHQQQESLEQNAASVQLPSQDNGYNGAREEEEEETEVETEEAAEDADDSPTFWTACPFCFYMYEYPRVYAECTLRCDNCKRGFQAVRIRTPPPIIEGQEASFYCWGFFPLGVSVSHLQKNNGVSRWTPFSPLHDVSRNVQDHLNGKAAPKKNFVVNKNSGPRIYIDDVTDDIFMGISDRSDSSDAEWNTTKKKKVKSTKKGLKRAFKKRAEVIAVRVKDGRSGSDKDMENGSEDQEGVGVPTVSGGETSKKAVGSNPRRQSGRVAKELGKLDLNVEFNNNEGEEPAPRVIVGNRGNGQGEEENIEGIGFFEGLDEFLSNLPILSVVNDEKVKAA
ncbi:hypothetical protein OSB04_006340 [Centaurea solstitialis]|uniref:J domain-containing protein n=1 Tax=Centaurea solstitialis TaxID=347529 RepID=A0AA38THR2_9ASTR|nr:hypothetical protein OSB04_006340 [Centaurea solstitialis]